MFQQRDRVVDGNNVLTAKSEQVLDVTVYPKFEGEGPWRFVCPSDWNPEGSCGFVAFRRLDGLLSLLNSADITQIDIGPLRDATSADYEAEGA